MTSDDRQNGGLEDDILSLLALEKKTLPAPAEVKERVLGRVEALVLPAGGSDGGTQSDASRNLSSQPSATRLGSLGIAKPLSLAIAFVVGGIASTVAHKMAADPPIHEILYVDRVVSAPSQAKMAAPESSAPVAPPSLPIPTAIVLGDRSAATPTPSGVAVGPQGSEERALLDVARLALKRGDGEATLAALANHEKRFAHGQFSEERMALRVHGLVLVGRTEEARAAGASFHDKYPDSVLMPAVDAALGTIP